MRADPIRFAFTGLITCGHCGCAVVAQMQRGTYIYYHCSGFRQKCPEKYVREEALAEAFSAQLSRLRMDDEVFSLIERVIRESHADKSRERIETLDRLRADSDRLQQRLDKLYVDHLDGRITPDMHDRMAATWRDERARCQRQIDVLHNAEDAFVDDGVALLDLARNAHRTFNKQSQNAKNAALNLLVSNSTWANGELTVTFREPFGMLEESAFGDPPPGPPIMPGGGGVSKWLPIRDTSRTILCLTTEEARKTISRYRALTMKGHSPIAQSESSSFLKDAPLPPPREPTKGIRKRERDRAERVMKQGGPKISLRDRALALTLERGEVRTKELTAIGIPRCYLARMCDERLLEKVGYGRYRMHRNRTG